ncbi:hypothetical protein D3C72_2178580 [compost metagenome]
MRMKSMESNSPRVVTTRMPMGLALSTVRRPWPALVLGAMQSGRGAPIKLAVRVRKA